MHSRHYLCTKIKVCFSVQHKKTGVIYQNSKKVLNDDVNFYLLTSSPNFLARRAKIYPPLLPKIVIKTSHENRVKVIKETKMTENLARAF